MKSTLGYFYLTSFLTWVSNYFLAEGIDCFVGAPESGLVIVFLVYAEYGLVLVEAVPGLNLSLFSLLFSFNWSYSELNAHACILFRKASWF